MSRATVETNMPRATVESNMPTETATIKSLMVKFIRELPTEKVIPETPAERAITVKPADIVLTKLTGTDTESPLHTNYVTGITIEHLDGNASVDNIPAYDYKTNNLDEIYERFYVQDCHEPLIRYGSYNPRNIDSRL